MAHLSSVLLVDDDSTENFLNQMLLTSMDVADTIVLAESGDEALHALAERCPSPAAPACPALWFVDVNMPVMNGIQFLEAYQQTPLARQHAPVIIMLAAASMHSSDLDRLDELAIAGLVRKPLTREKVETILQLHF